MPPCVGDEQSRLRGISGRRTRLKKCPRGSVSGIDYSAVSVEKSRRVNRKAIEAGRRTSFSGVRLHTNSRGWLCVTAKNE